LIAVSDRRNFAATRPFFSHDTNPEGAMGRGLILWLIGIPLPIILLVWALGGLN
jgi:hypothetical protein